MFQLGPIRFDPAAVATVLVIGALAVGTVYALRGVLAVAPEAVFPLLLTVLVGGALVVAWWGRRRSGPG